MSGELDDPVAWMPPCADSASRSASAQSPTPSHKCPFVGRVQESLDKERRLGSYGFWDKAVPEHAPGYAGAYVPASVRAGPGRTAMRLEECPPPFG